MQIQLINLPNLVLIVGILTIAVSVILLVYSRGEVSKVEFWSGGSARFLKGTEYENKLVCRVKPETLVFVKDQELKPKIVKQGLQTVRLFHASETNCRLFDPQDYSKDTEKAKMKQVEQHLQLVAEQWIAKNEDQYHQVIATDINWNDPVQVGVVTQMERMEADRRGMVNIMPSELGRHEDSGLKKDLDDWNVTDFSFVSMFLGLFLGMVILFVVQGVGWL